MALLEKNDIKQIFADQAPSIDKPASFANYPRGWDTARPNNGKPTIKQFNYLQQRTDQNFLWIHQNGAALPYDAAMEYAEGAVVIKDGELQQKQGSNWNTVGGGGYGQKWKSNPNGYALNARVMLDNGDIVKSTVANNTKNPNIDMTGWELPQTKDFYDRTGKSQQEINKENGISISFEKLVDNVFTDIERINILNLNRDTVFKKSELALPIDGISIVEDAAGQVWVRQFNGEVRTSSFTTSNPLSAALQAASVLGYDVIVDTEINLSANIEIPTGVLVRFTGKGKVNNFSLILNTYSALQNPNIYRSQSGYNAGATIKAGSVGAAISGGMIESGTPLIIHNTKRSIVNGVNLKSNGGYLIYNDGAEDCEITNNICTAVGGWGIQSSSRQINNLISGNRIIGDGVCRTGIITLASGDSGSSVAPDTVRGNMILNNHVTDISEEGISIDYDVALNYRTVKSVISDASSQIINYIDSDEGLTVRSAESVIAMSGLAAGHGISSKGGAGRVVYTQPNMFRKLAAGDKLGLGFTALNNVIQGNRVERCQRNGIMLYGGNTGTVIEGNTVLHCGWGAEYSYQGRAPYRWGGIGVFSLSRARVAPTQGVIVTNNKLVGNSHAIDIGVARWEGTDLTPPANIQTYGNIFVDNETDLTPDWLPQ